MTVANSRGIIPKSRANIICEGGIQLSVLSPMESESLRQTILEARKEATILALTDLPLPEVLEEYSNDYLPINIISVDASRIIAFITIPFLKLNKKEASTNPDPRLIIPRLIPRV